MEIRLEPSDEKDAPFFYQNYLQSFAPIRKRYPGTIPYEDYHSVQDVERTLRNRNFDFFKIYYNGEIVGAINLGLVEDGRICRIRMFFIVPEYQNMGIGTKALNIAESMHTPLVAWELCAIKDESIYRNVYEKSGYSIMKIITALSPGVRIVKYRKENTLH